MSFWNHDQVILTEDHEVQIRVMDFNDFDHSQEDNEESMEVPSDTPETRPDTRPGESGNHPGTPMDDEHDELTADDDEPQALWEMAGTDEDGDEDMDVVDDDGDEDWVDEEDSSDDDGEDKENGLINVDEDSDEEDIAVPLGRNSSSLMDSVSGFGSLRLGSLKRRLRAEKVQHVTREDPSYINDPTVFRAPLTTRLGFRWSFRDAEEVRNFERVMIDDEHILGLRVSPD